MPENTNNDSPDADRPTARADQETPSKTGGAAHPPSETAAEREAQEAVQRAAEQGAQQRRPEVGSPTDTAP